MKTTSALFSLCTILFLCFSTNGMEPSWYLKLKQVEILKTSKSDIERIFEKSKITQSFENFGVETVFYEAPDGEFTVQYSTGICAVKDADPESTIVETYKVEKGIVLNIIFFPKKRLKFSAFKVNRNQTFKAQEGDDPANHYVNKEQGINYTVQLGKVIDIKLFAPDKLDSLKCLN